MITSGLNQTLQSMLVLAATSLIAGADPKPRFEINFISEEAHAIYPAAINNHGVIAGAFGSGADNFQPVRYRNGLVETLPLDRGLAADINLAGDVIVRSSFPHTNHLIRAGVPILVETEDGRPLFVWALNNRREVVGIVHDGTVSSGNLIFPRIYAASWSNGVARRIGPNNPDLASRALDINDSGVAVGTVYEMKTNGTTEAVMFRRGQTIPLGTLPGFPASVATAINSHGDVVGYAYNSQAMRAFLVRSGTIRNLGALPGATVIYPNGLNNFGHVVGYAQGPRERHRAFLYVDGAMHDLTEFVKAKSGWTFLTANAINDKGQIVGIGQLNGGAHRMFLLTPRKDPSWVRDRAAPRQPPVRYPGLLQPNKRSEAH